MYSEAFRRLGGVTQVVGGAELQLFHNRLTHSLKVAQIGRSLAVRLGRNAHQSELEAGGGLDVAVVEAACLAHDLGHPPFGHIGESQLDLRTQECGGFEGNAQSFRIVTKLSVRSLAQDQRGLNLTRATLAALLKYPILGREARTEPLQKFGAYEEEAEDFAFARSLQTSGRSLEADVMDWADDITYAVHDLEDFYRAGLIPLERVSQSDDEVAEFLKYVERSPIGRNPGDDEVLDDLRSTFFPTRSYQGTIEDRAFLHDVASALITRYLNDSSVVGGHLSVPASLSREVELLKQLTWYYVIDDPRLATLQQGQRRVIRQLYGKLLLLARPAWGDQRARLVLPQHLQNMLEIGQDDRGAGEEVARRVCKRATSDYVASLSEEQAFGLFHRVMHGSAPTAFEPWVRQ